MSYFFDKGKKDRWQGKHDPPKTDNPIDRIEYSDGWNWLDDYWNDIEDQNESDNNK